MTGRTGRYGRRVGLLVGPALFVSAAAACGPAPARFDAKPYAGRYEGTWSHEPGGTSGAVVVDIRPSAKVAAATVVVDLGGNVLGTGDPPPTELTALLDGEVATVQRGTVVLGQVAFEIRQDGTISGTNSEFLRGTMGALSCEGRITTSRLEVVCTGRDDPATVMAVRADHVS